jgi:hypothetical protein
MSDSERPAQVQVQADAGTTRVFIGPGGKVADEPTQEEQQASPQEFAKVHRGAFAFDADGDLTRQHERAEINVATADVFNHGGEILKTARTQHGTPARTLTPDTIVEAGGMSMRLAQAEQAGYVKRDEHGRYVETTAAERAEAARRQQSAGDSTINQSPEFRDTNDMQPEPFSPEIEAALAKAAEPLGSRASEILTPVMVELAISAADTGSLSVNIEDVMSKTGLSRENAEAFIGHVMPALTEQVDAVLEKRGINPQEFVEWARETRPAQFKAALVAQVNARTLEGYRALAEAYLRDTVPTEDALRKGGFETMHHPTTGELLVKIRGVWMNARAAARNGMI